MITLKETNESLQIAVSEIFDFDASREILLNCKDKTYSKIDITLNQITSCNSFAIGALSLLADKSTGAFNVDINQCGEEVHQLFESGFLNLLLKIKCSANSKPESKTAITRCGNSAHHVFNH